MSSMNISHFLFCSVPSWGKNLSFIALLSSTHLIFLIGHVRPFCTLATRLVREQETIIVTFIVAAHVLNKTRTEILRHFLDKALESSKVLQRIRYITLLRDVHHMPYTYLPRI